MPLIQVPYRPIPERLYHYTKGDAAFSIISGGMGIGDEICFWLKNAQSKNDSSELKLGMALIDGLQNYMHRNNRSSIINEVDINPELVYINSFTEEENITEHMLDEYGNFRLEFDFRTCKQKNDIHECIYFKDDDIDELIQNYCSTFDRDWNLISGEKKDINALCDYLVEGMSAIRSIPLLKHMEEWEKENEWRHVLHRQPKDDRMFTLKDGTERMKAYYSLATLKGITCFSAFNRKSKDLPYYYKIKHWVAKCGWDVKTNIVII